MARNIAGMATMLTGESLKINLRTLVNSAKDWKYCSLQQSARADKTKPIT